MNKKRISLTLGIMCLILSFGIVLQLNTIKSATETVGQTTKENGLRDEVLKWKEKYDSSYEQLERAEKTLEEARQQASKNDTNSTSKGEELQTANELLGATELSGKGAIVTLKDNQSVTTQSIGALDNISYYLVHDEDIRRVVNELKNAGAEAISINDERLVSTSAITCDGNVVLVNGKKISSPFVIKAIGNPESFSGALLRPGGYIETLNQTGIITDVKKSDNITIPKYSGVIDFKHIKESK